jgi:thioredoxin reductase (NADPH)
VLPTLMPAQIARLAAHGHVRPVQRGEGLAEAGAVIARERHHLLALVQTDSELSEIFLRAFILRRVALLAHGFGDVVLVGSRHAADTLRIPAFLTRNGHPYASIDLDREAGVQALLDRSRVTVDDVPVVICRSAVVLRHPTNGPLADGLGFNEAIDRIQVRDLVIVGAGPSGLSAAVYGVFAVGDVRGGNIKRVAAAVGEGSMAVAFGPQVLRE